MTENLLIAAENPVKPADIDQVSLIATPESRTIGRIIAARWYMSEGEARDVAGRYVELLRAKYPDWTLGGEVMDGNSRIVEVNFDEAPYNLQLRLVRDEPKPKRRRKTQHQTALLSDAEARRVVAAMKVLHQGLGGWDVVAATLEMSKAALVDVRMGRNRVSMALALRVARASGTTLERLIAPMGSASVCPACGAERRSA